MQCSHDIGKFSKNFGPKKMMQKALHLSLELAGTHYTSLETTCTSNDLTHHQSAWHNRKGASYKTRAKVKLTDKHSSQ